MALDVLHSGNLVYSAVIYYLGAIVRVLQGVITTAGTGNLLLSVCALYCKQASMCHSFDPDLMLKSWKSVSALMGDKNIHNLQLFKNISLYLNM